MNFGRPHLRVLDAKPVFWWCWQLLFQISPSSACAQQTTDPVDTLFHSFSTTFWVYVHELCFLQCLGTVSLFKTFSYCVLRIAWLMILNIIIIANQTFCTKTKNGIVISGSFLCTQYNIHRWNWLYLLEERRGTGTRGQSTGQVGTADTDGR